MQIIDFKELSLEDAHYEVMYPNWSRAYEYPIVINTIKKHWGYGMEGRPAEQPTIHNSSWGFEGVHVTFRDELDKLGSVTNTDIVKSQFCPTQYYDITTRAPQWQNSFDFVLNVSTIEHLSKDKQILALENLLDQVKVGGYLITTFDWPRVDLSMIESWCGVECIRATNPLTGANSVVPNPKYSELRIIFLCMKKS